MRIHLKIILFLLIIFIFNSVFAATEQLVKFSNELSEAEISIQVRRSGLKVMRYIPEINLYVLEPDESIVGSLSVLNQSPQSVEYSELNREIKMVSTPNDRSFSQQKGLEIIEAERAWDTTTGSREVVVAVVDTGVSLNHRELKNQLWVNHLEVPNNGLDDDGNGYVDDINGYDFYNSDAIPDDDNLHGTHVTGIIGAESNNIEGIAGVNWNVRIMAVKFLNHRGSGTALGGIDGIIYAAKNGAKVINASWGGVPDSGALRDAIEYAKNQGALVIAAAGNDGRNTDNRPLFPGSIDHAALVSVGSVDPNLSKSSFSNYGNITVDVAAPGKDILSTVPGNKYERLSGTSMATPMVSGVAALMLSIEDLEVTDLRNAVLNAVHEKSNLSQVVGTSGLINASVAINQLLAGPQVWPQTHSIARGNVHQMTAYKLKTPVEWAVEDGHIAEVDSQGLVRGKNGGVTRVLAFDSDGNVHSSKWLKVVGASDPREPKDGPGDPDAPDHPEKPSDPEEPDEPSENPGGGGCSKSVQGENTEAGVSFYMLLLILPLVLLVSQFKN